MNQTDSRVFRQTSFSSQKNYLRSVVIKTSFSGRELQPDFTESLFALPRFDEIFGVKRNYL